MKMWTPFGKLILVLCAAGYVSSAIEEYAYLGRGSFSELDYNESGYVPEDYSDLLGQAWADTRDAAYGKASVEFLLSELEDLEIINSTWKQCSVLCTCDENNIYAPRCSWCGFGLFTTCNEDVWQSNDAIAGVSADEFEIAIANTVTIGRVTMPTSTSSNHPPLLKKFGWFNSGVVPPDIYKRQAVLRALELTKSDIRIDFGMGVSFKVWDDMFAACPGSPQSGTRACKGVPLNQIVRSTSMFTRLMTDLQNVGVTLQSSVTYTPYVLQPKCPSAVNCNNRHMGGQPARCPGVRFEGQPVYCRPDPLASPNCWRCPAMGDNGSFIVYQSVVRTWASTIRSRTVPSSIEIGNEPDMVDLPCPRNKPQCARFDLTFFKGTGREALAQFAAGTNAARQGDPYATVSGPALAGPGMSDNMWDDIRYLTARDVFQWLARQSNPKLDVFTYHVVCLYCYNHGPTPPMNRHRHWIGTRANLARKQMRNADPSNTKFTTVGLAVNEWHPCTHCKPGSCNCGPPYIDSTRHALDWLDSTFDLLKIQDLEQLNWVFLVELGPPVVAALNINDFSGAAGARFVFWAAAFYADLPVGRRIDLQGISQGLRHMASYHPQTQCGGAIIWNPTGRTVNIGQFVIRDLPANTQYGYTVYEMSDRMSDRKWTAINNLCIPSSSDSCSSQCRKGGSGVYRDRFLDFPCTAVKRRLTTQNRQLIVNNLRVQALGVTYVKFFREGASCSKAKISGINVLRQERYYQVRGPPAGKADLHESYAHFDWREMVAHMGPGSYNLRTGLTLITGFTGSFAPGKTARRIGFQFTGKVNMPRNGLLGIRIDFVTSESGDMANYGKSIFIMDGSTDCVTMPKKRASGQCQIPRNWGTRADVPAGNFIRAKTSRGASIMEFRHQQVASVDLDSLKPGGWNGKFTVLFVVRGAARHDSIRWFMVPA